jgi:hypothetical protein
MFIRVIKEDGATFSGTFRPAKDRTRFYKGFKYNAFSFIRRALKLENVAHVETQFKRIGSTLHAIFVLQESRIVCIKSWSAPNA